MPDPIQSSEVEKINDLLRLEVANRPKDEFVKTFLRQIETLDADVLKTFRKALGQTLIEREASGKGHLKVEAMMELLDFSRFQAWLVGSGISELSVRNIVAGLKSRSTDDFNRIIHGEGFLDVDQKNMTDILLEEGIPEIDIHTFHELIHNVDLSVSEYLERVFKLNYLAEAAVRRESLRGTMNLKEIVKLYLYTVIQVALSDYGLKEETIAQIADRLGLSNNMERQFLIVQQLERYFFSLTTSDDVSGKPIDFWLHLINEYELKTALEQYVAGDKMEKSEFEMAELHGETKHLFDDVSELKNETLAVISITYRLDNPEEKGHSAEELIMIIDQINLLTKEIAPLLIVQRDIFAFFEILGECDHHNRFFRETIIKFRSRLKRLADAKEKAGDRITLANLVITYLYSRLDAFLDDYDTQEDDVLEGIRNRLSQCHDFERQFAITDLIEEHLYSNPGILQIADSSYWPELINTFELNIILEIYIRRGYLSPGKEDLTKNQMLDRIQSEINGIENITVKSLSVTFLTAHLSAHLEHSKEEKLTLHEVLHTLAQLERDAQMAAEQIQMQSRVKRELLTTLTEKLFRLEAIQQSMETLEGDRTGRLDEVIVGLRTRRDNLMGGKMDPEVLEQDIRNYLSDKKVVALIDDVEAYYRDHMASVSRVRK
jgi:hypothetical protein